MAAGIQQNIGRDWGLEVWKEMAYSSPNKVFTNTAECSAKKASNDASEHLGLVEIKNPFSLQSKTLMEVTLKSAFCLERDGTTNSFRLKPRHDYYHQVQTQLYCTRRHWCDFVVRTNKELFVERIYKDQSWLDTNLNKLSKFYFSSVIPELACPRHPNLLFIQLLIIIIQKVTIV